MPFYFIIHKSPAISSEMLRLLSGSSCQNGIVNFISVCYTLNNNDSSNRGGMPREKAGGDEVGKRRKKKKRFRWIKFILEVILLIGMSAGLFVGYKLSKIERGSIREEQLVKNESISQDELDRMSRSMTVALFGVDSRNGELEGGANSDTIMVCRIDTETGEIRLASVYRDTYLDTGEGEYRKCTEAYSIGGAQQAISMLNKNLDLNISDYVTVNFAALVEIVDLFGGVDVTLSEGEVSWLNNYLVEGRQVLGKECEDVPGPGRQHLNGMQALAYSRIRYIGLDYERTERQRIVLEQVLEKAKDCDLLMLNQVIDTILPMVSTNLSAGDLLKLAKGTGKYYMAETTGFPDDKTEMKIEGSDCVVPVNLAENVSRLHDYLYGSKDYVPSETVQEISSYIGNVTGIY